MSFYSSIHRYASDWVRARRAAYTARVVSDLPAEIRKDIGWPVDGSASRAWTVAR